MLPGPLVLQCVPLFLLLATSVLARSAEVKNDASAKLGKAVDNSKLVSAELPIITEDTAAEVDSDIQFVVLEVSHNASENKSRKSRNRSSVALQTIISEEEAEFGDADDEFPEGMIIRNHEGEGFKVQLSNVAKANDVEDLKVADKEMNEQLKILKSDAEVMNTSVSGLALEHEQTQEKIRNVQAEQLLHYGSLLTKLNEIRNSEALNHSEQLGVIGEINPKFAETQATIGKLIELITNFSIDTKNAIGSAETKVIESRDITNSQFANLDSSLKKKIDDARVESDQKVIAEIGKSGANILSGQGNLATQLKELQVDVKGTVQEEQRKHGVLVADHFDKVFLGTTKHKTEIKEDIQNLGTSVHNTLASIERKRDEKNDNNTAKIIGGINGLGESVQGGLNVLGDGFKQQLEGIEGRAVDRNNGHFETLLAGQKEGRDHTSQIVDSLGNAFSDKLKGGHEAILEAGSKHHNESLDLLGRHHLDTKGAIDSLGTNLTNHANGHFETLLAGQKEGRDHTSQVVDSLGNAFSDKLKGGHEAILEAGSKYHNESLDLLGRHHLDTKGAIDSLGTNLTNHANELNAAEIELLKQNHGEILSHFDAKNAENQKNLVDLENRLHARDDELFENNAKAQKELHSDTILQFGKGVGELNTNINNFEQRNKEHQDNIAAEQARINAENHGLNQKRFDELGSNFNQGLQDLEGRANAKIDAYNNEKALLEAQRHDELIGLNKDHHKAGVENLEAAEKRLHDLAVHNHQENLELRNGQVAGLSDQLKGNREDIFGAIQSQGEAVGKHLNEVHGSINEEMAGHFKSLDGRLSDLNQQNIEGRQSAVESINALQLKNHLEATKRKEEVEKNILKEIEKTGLKLKDITDEHHLKEVEKLEILTEKADDGFKNVLQKGIEQGQQIEELRKRLELSLQNIEEQINLLDFSVMRRTELIMLKQDVQHEMAEESLNIQRDFKRRQDEIDAKIKAKKEKRAATIQTVKNVLCVQLYSNIAKAAGQVFSKKVKSDFTEIKAYCFPIWINMFDKMAQSKAVQKSKAFIMKLYKNTITSTTKGAKKAKKGTKALGHKIVNSSHAAWATMKERYKAVKPKAHQNKLSPLAPIHEGAAHNPEAHKKEGAAHLPPLPKKKKDLIHKMLKVLHPKKGHKA